MAQVNPSELLARLMRVVPVASAPAVARVVAQYFGAAMQPAEANDLAAFDQQKDHTRKPRRARGSRGKGRATKRAAARETFETPPSKQPVAQDVEMSEQPRAHTLAQPKQQPDMQPEAQKTPHKEQPTRVAGDQTQDQQDPVQYQSPVCSQRSRATAPQAVRKLRDILRPNALTEAGQWALANSSSRNVNTNTSLLPQSIHYRFGKKVG
jgi:hypothetical protein